MERFNTRLFELLCSVYFCWKKDHKKLMLIICKELSINCPYIILVIIKCQSLVSALLQCEVVSILLLHSFHRTVLRFVARTTIQLYPFKLVLWFEWRQLVSMNLIFTRFCPLRKETRLFLDIIINSLLTQTYKIIHIWHRQCGAKCALSWC